MPIARIRKAIVAAVTAAVTTTVATLWKSPTVDVASVAQATGVGVAAGIAIGWATWRVPNTAASSAPGSEVTQ